MEGDDLPDQGNDGGHGAGRNDVVLLQAGIAEEVSPQIIDELEAFAPAQLPTAGVISTAQKYNTLYTRFYETLQVQQRGQVQHLITTFTVLADARLEPYRGLIPELAGVQASPQGLFHVLYLLKNATVHITRDQKAQLVTAMNQDPVNAVLRAGYVEAGDNAEEADYLITLFNRYINHILTSISLLHKKTRLGVEAYSWYNQLQTHMRQLQTKVQEMMYTLCTRNEANAVAHLVVRYRAKTLEALNDFVRLKDQAPLANCRMNIAAFNEVNGFQFDGANGLTALVENRTLWSNFIFQPRFEATDVAELEELRGTLNDLFKEIKCFVPSDLDRAQDTAKNLRPAILATCQDYDLFVDSEVKTTGTASSIMDDIRNHRTTI